MAEKIFVSERSAKEWAAQNEIDLTDNLEHRGMVWVVPHPQDIRVRKEAKPEPNPQPQPNKKVVLHSDK